MGMSIVPKIILIELNEVPFRVFDAFCEKHPESELSGLMKRCHQFVTTCEDEIELDPWISWPTLHRGVTDRQHRILSLGQVLDKVDEQYPPIWRLLTAGGRTAGIFGSLHSSHIPSSTEQYKFYLPDFFDDQVFAHPPVLHGFQSFTLDMTRRSARNVDSAIPRSAVLGFMRSATQLGFSPSTAYEIVSQLMHERKEPRVRLRRRSLQALLAADVFTRMLRKDMPDFSTLYTNHVAAAMHRYWRAAFPTDYDSSLLQADWQQQYGAEVLESMRITDKIIGKLRRFVDDRDDTKLLIASSMGQCATDHPPSTGLYTVRNLEKFLAAFGVERGQFQQRHAMVPCAGFVVDAVTRDRLKQQLDQFRIGDTTNLESEKEISPMSYGLHDGNFFSLYMNFDGYSGEHVGYVGNRAMSFEDLGIEFFPHEDGVSVTAHHHPDGVLLVYDRKRPPSAIARQRISTLEIAPALLGHYGIRPPDYMTTPGVAIRNALAAA
jgi:hypothetical protein